MNKMSLKELFENSLNNMHSSLNKHLANILVENNFLQPEMDVTETEKYIYIIISVPGISKDSIDIGFRDNEITITGEKTFPKELNNSKFLFREIIYGNFKRKFKLPIIVTDKKSIKTDITNGILKITINKKLGKNNYFSVRVKD